MKSPFTVSPISDHHVIFHRPFTLKTLGPSKHKPRFYGPLPVTSTYNPIYSMYNALK